MLGEFLGFTLSSFQITQSSASCIYLGAHYILCSSLSYDWKLVPFDCFHPICNYKFDLFFYKFVCMFAFEV